MKTIKFTKKVDSYLPGDIATVENNVAHRYIDRGQAHIENDKVLDYKNEMIDTRKHSGRYKVKDVESS
jgi:hypothetical protein